MLQRMELSHEHAVWLEEVRKIPSELAAEIGFVSKGKNLAFEFRRNDVCLFHKIRTPDKKFWIEPAGSELFFWNEDCLNVECSRQTPLIICEGEIDAASWLAAGATRVVSVPNGATDKPGEDDIKISEDRQFAYLWEGNGLKPSIAKFSKIILATDNDRAGLNLRSELAVRLGRSRCYVVEYPEGCKDANDVLQKCGPDAHDVLMHMIDQAKPMVPDRLVQLLDIPSRGDLPRYDTGWSVLNQHLQVVPPELMVITGTPGSGKSQWSLALVLNLARLHRLKGAILQFEDDPDRNRRDILRYAEAWAGNDNAGIHPEKPEVWAKRMFLGISPKEEDDDTVSFNLEWLQRVIEEAATRHGCKWVLIDPWNEVEHLWKVNENETTYTNNALRELKRLGRKFQIAIIIVAHPAKGVKGKTLDELDLYDVSGSKAWNDKADHGIVIHRDPQDTSITHVKVCKSKRWDVLGVPGAARLQFVREKAGFVSVISK